METQGSDKPDSLPLLRLYEEMSRRFREKGTHASPGTREKCYNLLLALLWEERPMKPYELLSHLFFDPAYIELKDPKRLLFYNLQKLMKSGMVKADKTNGNAPHYKMAEELKPCFVVSRPKGVSQITDARVKPVLAIWGRVSMLRGIAKQWSFTSIAHSMVYELGSLMRYLDGLVEESNVEGRRRLRIIKSWIPRLMEVYTDYGVSGILPEDEAALFNSCEKRIQKFCKRIWWSYGGK